MINILITGAAGLLGQYLTKHHKSNANILCIDLAENPFPELSNNIFIQADLTDFASLRKEISDFKPELIYNCAAFSDVDGCETNKDLAVKLNIDLVDNLISIPHSKLIQYSSDYVFNGKNGPNTEDDQVDPLNHYGWTKMQSEKLLEKSARDFLIIRTNVLYGTGNNIRPNFISWVIDNLRRNQNIHVASDQFNNPTYAGNLVGASIEAAGKHSGIMHIGGSDYMSRYDVAVKTAEIFNLNSNLIGPINTAKLNQPASRPLKAGLRVDKAVGLLKTRLLRLEDGLRLAYKH
ncbi:MAG: SDR family oxidoreductase [candidate division Zixibacteria bacterium]|nr:SDR family oxidoreductase [candidate division Zixibacteria bacterium]